MINLPQLKWFSVSAVILGLLLSSQSIFAAGLTREQSKELSTIRRDMSKVSSDLRRKKYDEAEKQLDTLQEQLDKIVTDAKLEKRNKLVAIVYKMIRVHRKNIELKRSGKKGRVSLTDISFQEEVAPILNDRCNNCHGTRPAGGLRLNTFEMMKQGGENGPLLVQGNPRASLIIKRLLAPEKLRMPKDSQKLEPEEIKTIAEWISQGAKFDGTSETAKIGIENEPKPTKGKPKPKEPVKIVKATGKETVSFSKDVAPWMVQFCFRCHSGNQPQSEFSIATFETLMQGGSSGRVVLPGNPDDSRIWHLVGLQDPFKMPRGQGLIKRAQADSLKTWIAEGAKFDGKDAKQSLRELVPTDEAIRAAELAAMTPQQFSEFRLKRTQDQWKRFLPNEQSRHVKTKEFIFFGNVSSTRMQEISLWAEEDLKSLKELFRANSSPVWKGKLTIFLIKDRFGYTELNQVLHNRRVPAETTGHSEVTATFEEAYVALQDIGDESSSDSPGLRVNLIAQLSGAVLKRSDNRLPNWLTQGTGLALASKAVPGNEYLKSLSKSALELLPTADTPESIFANGTFSPSGTAAVGYTLVNFMLNAQGGNKFGQFLRLVQTGNNVQSAVRTCYQTDLKTLGNTYFAYLKKNVSPGKGKR